MKKFCLILCSLFLHFCNVQSQDIVELTEELNFDFSYRDLNVSNQAKSMRASKRGGGKIVLNTIENTTSKELITSINVAKDVWENYIPSGDTIKIDVYFESNLNSDISLGILYQLDNEQGLYYPSCLYRKKFDAITSNYDAMIHINTSTNWSIGLGKENSHAQKNLTLAFMQCICKCLGFGTSLKTGSRGVEFKQRRNATIFDSFVVCSNGTKLTDYLSNNNALQLFATGQLGDVCFIGNNTNARLYCPSVFDDNYTVKATFREDSLMDYDVENHDYDLLVDDLTLNILNELGWNFNSSSAVSIKSDDIDNTGITSAYSSHSFYIFPSQNNISSCSWKLILPSTDGTPTTCAESNNQTFVIPAVSNPDAYEHSIEGDIHGCVTFDGVVDGETVHLTYPIILELAPRIISASVISTMANPENPNYFDAVVEITYEGSHYIHAYVEEEYNPYLTSYYSSTPFYTKMYLTNIAAYGDAWLDITVRNDYGSDNQSLDLNYPMISAPPSSPIIEDFELHYDDYDFTQHDFVNLRFSCKVKNPQADEIIMMGTDFGEDHISKDVCFSFHKRMELSPESGIFTITDEDCDINQWICFMGHNQYGWSENSDTILINNYIKDRDILQDLKQFTRIQAPTIGNENMLSWEQGVISLNSASCERMQIFSSQGVLVSDVIKPKSGYKQILEKGTYIVKITIEGNCYTKKIII